MNINHKETIFIEDLMIGLSQILDSETGEIITVTQPIISLCNINPERFNKKYKPIEITPHRLVQSGFIKSYDFGLDNCFTIKIDDHTIFEYFLRQNFYNIVQGCEFNKNNFVQFRETFKYYHELQNIFYILAKQKIHITK